MGINMGIGKLGGADLVIKRKFRWTFRIDNICGGKSVPEHFVKSASRPNLSIEPTELNFLNAKTWVPGKGSWEPITITYYDVASPDAANALSWMASVYDFTKPTELKQSSARTGYSGTGTLNLYDGCGTVLETWIMKDLWPESINFGDLDYSDSEFCTIELSLRYSDVEYIGGSCGGSVSACCKGC